MNQEYPRQKLLVVIGILFGVTVIAAIVILYFMFGTAPSATVANLESCSPNIQAVTKEAVEGTLLQFITDANSHSGSTTSGEYVALVRDGSCKQTDYDDFRRTEMIVDIERVGQSWRVEYYWNTADEEWRDLGDIAVNCVAPEDVVFKDFGCDNMDIFLRGEAYVLAPVYPIEQHLPYFDRYYSITSLGVQQGRLQIVIKINMPLPTRENNIQLAEGYKSQALSKIREFGFNPNDFQITFTWNK